MQEKLVCNHCKYPILSDGVELRIRKLNSNDFVVGFYHNKCLSAFIDLFTVREYISHNNLGGCDFDRS